ncbi:MAG: ABC transporter permease [Caulobacteraceae bacterium]|nr:ABC transporter permease [Caulobacteraceae bacterium]
MNGAFDPKRWWPAPLLPLGDARDLTLLFVVAALSFLAGLAAIAALASERAAVGWRSELAGSATIIVRAQGAETPDAAALRAVVAVSGLRGVGEVRALEKAKADQLLAPWIGADALPSDLPVPRLVTVELDPKTPATGADLDRALSAAGVDATVDDHSRWSAEIMRAGVIERNVALGLFALLLAILGAVISFATRQGLAARREIVDALHLSGATDGFIARLFQARFARSAAQAGLAGALLAAAMAAALKLTGAGQGLTALLPIAWRDLAAPAPFPVLGALIAAVVARTTATAALKEVP